MLTNSQPPSVPVIQIITGALSAMSRKRRSLSCSELLDAPRLLQQHGHEIQRRRAQQQELLQSGRGVSPAMHRNTDLSADCVAATAKKVRMAVAAVAPRIPNRTAAQNRNTTGAYSRVSANPR